MERVFGLVWAALALLFLLRWFLSGIRWYLKRTRH
jgi:hypothetical protein